MFHRAWFENHRVLKMRGSSIGLTWLGRGGDALRCGRRHRVAPMTGPSDLPQRSCATRRSPNAPRLTLVPGAGAADRDRRRNRRRRRGDRAPFSLLCLRRRLGCRWFPVADVGAGTVAAGSSGRRGCLGCPLRRQRSRRNPGTTLRPPTAPRGSRRVADVSQRSDSSCWGCGHGPSTGHGARTSNGDGLRLGHGDVGGGLLSSRGQLRA